MAAIDDLDLSRATWRKSTYSNNGGECVEVAAASGAVLVRDTKNRPTPVLAFGTEPWKRFIARLKADVS